jgi:hypothetical protein
VTLQLDPSAECVAASATPERPTATTSGTIKRDVRRMTAKPIPIAPRTLDPRRNLLDEVLDLVRSRGV